MSMGALKRAGTVEQALQYLEENAGRAVILAGGTDLMVQVNQYNYPEETVFVCVENIPELQGIYLTEDKIQIGSLATAAEIAKSPVIQKFARALAVAAQESASPQVRNRATIGGNIGTASPSADMVTALIALDAEAEIVGTDGCRTIKVKDIGTFVKKTCLKETDIIRKIIIRKQSGLENSSFQKMGKRKAMTISIVNTAASVRLSEDKKVIESVRIAVGACAPVIKRLEALEQALIGCEATADAVRMHMGKALDDIAPITDMRATQWYRKEIAQVFAVRTVCDAIQAVRGEV